MLGKGHKERIVPVPGKAREALTAWLALREPQGLLAMPLFTNARGLALSERGVGEGDSVAVMCRSMGKLVPASAAAPSGHSFIRRRASSNRDRSRANIST